MTYVVRAWLPDRPGALGAVASRIGAVHGDVVGIEILERDGGRAVDEFIVEVPDGDVLPLLVHEIGQVDGVDVEEVRLCADIPSDPRLDALETAASLVAAGSAEHLLATLVELARRDFAADWCAVTDLETRTCLVAEGDPPAPAWLAAFVDGARSSQAVAGIGGPDDVACAELTGAGIALVLGRRDRPLRSRERRQLVVLAVIADHRWAGLAAAKKPRPRRSSPVA